MLLGKMVQANSHLDYTCRILQRGEVDHPPEASDYGLGTFVSISLDDAGDETIVGLVYNTVVINREIGSRGPRLADWDTMEQMSPDLLRESGALVGIVAVGMMRPGGPEQGVPELSPQPYSHVHTMDEAEVAAFHDHGGHVRVAYLPYLLQRESPLVAGMVMKVLKRLEAMFPHDHDRLNILRKDVMQRIQGWN